jgi:xylan 1,4-beta-xylosidase
MKHKFLILICVLSNLIGFSQNLIQNGSFEDGESSWYFIDNNAYTSTNFDYTEVNDGLISLRLNLLNPDSVVTAGVLQTIEINPNTTYYLYYSVKTENVDYLAFPYLKFTDGVEVFAQQGYISGHTKDWTTYEMRFTTPPQMNYLSLFFFLTGKLGTVWIDNFYIEEVQETNNLLFTVDLSDISGSFNNKLLCTNSSPIRPNSSNDFTQEFIDLGIQEVRVHDIYNTCDINIIFPDFSANPYDTNSYDFSATDLVIESIYNANSNAFFRLGYSYDINSVNNISPSDFEKWATICKHIVMHYNDGWNNGYYYEIEKWEIWNEPDLQHFWLGTPQQFYDLYQTTANKLKAFDNNLKIGAAGFAFFGNKNFIGPFLDSIVANNTPLDFFSYHSYTYSNPYYYAVQVEDLRNILSVYNLENIELLLTEWNNYSYSTENTIIEFGRDDALSAALTASSFYYLQNSFLSAAYRYRTDEYFFGLFRDNGEHSYSGLAFKIISELINNEILQTSGSDSLGNVCFAGKNFDNTNINVIVSNPNRLSNTYTIEFQNITQTMNYQIIRIDSNYEYSIVENSVVSPTSNTITSTVTPPFVDFISLNTYTGFNHHINNNEITIYPNPIVNQFEIITDRRFSYSEITIFSIFGQELLSIKNSLKVDISDLSNGIYLVQGILDDYVFTQKITKIN